MRRAHESPAPELEQPGRRRRLPEEERERSVAGEDVEVPVARCALAPDGVLRVDENVPRILYHRAVEILVDLLARGAIERLPALHDQLVDLLVGVPLLGGRLGLDTGDDRVGVDLPRPSDHADLEIGGVLVAEELIYLEQGDLDPNPDGLELIG